MGIIFLVLCHLPSSFFPLLKNLRKIFLIAPIRFNSIRNREILYLQQFRSQILSSDVYRFSYIFGKPFPHINSDCFQIKTSALVFPLIPVQKGKAQLTVNGQTEHRHFPLGRHKSVIALPLCTGKCFQKIQGFFIPKRVITIRNTSKCFEIII